MKRVLLIDLDGVIIKRRNGYFSDRFAAEYSIPVADIMVFFKNEYNMAAIGQISLREVLPKYLSQWGWKEDMDSFLLYWFEGEKEADCSVIEAIRQLRRSGIKVYVVSDNAQERAEYINRELDLTAIVDGTYYSYQVGHKKSEIAFFTKVLADIAVNAEDVLFIDDDTHNIEVGQTAGIAGDVYKPGCNISDLMLS